MEQSYCFKNKSLREYRYLHFLVFFFVLFCMALPLTIEAASLYFVPQSKTVYLNDIFIVEIMIDTEGEEVNACEVNVKFSPENLEIIDVSMGNSILSLWPMAPFYSNEEGTLKFTGGAPDGFSQQQLLGKIIFQVVAGGRAEVKFQEKSRVLLNDGKGTEAKLNTRGADFELLPEKREIPQNEWENIVKNDTVPPEPFEVIVSSNEDLFGEKYFIVFSATDEQSGINHYEIKEGRGGWKIGSSPYLLEDQSLKSEILVKAVDKAGNERVVEVKGVPLGKFDWADILLWVVLVILTAVVVWLIIIRRRSKRLLNS